MWSSARHNAVQRTLFRGSTLTRLVFTFFEHATMICAADLPDLDPFLYNGPGPLTSAVFFYLNSKEVDFTLPYNLTLTRSLYPTW